MKQFIKWRFKYGNKVKFNLSHVHYAKLTEGDTTTYEKPVPIPGAVKLVQNLMENQKVSMQMEDHITQLITIWDMMEIQRLR